MAMLIAVSISSLANASTEQQPWPLALRNQMERLADTGYRISCVGTAALPLCSSTTTTAGVGLDFIAAYDTTQHDVVGSILSMSDRPQIASVAQGSPANAAGVLPGDDLLSIKGEDTLALLAKSADPTLFADELEQKLAELPAEITFTFKLRREGRVFEVYVKPSRTCTGRFEVVSPSWTVWRLS